MFRAPVDILSARQASHQVDGVAMLEQNAGRSNNRMQLTRAVASWTRRLRVGEIRVFYDVSEKTVEVLAIISKEEAAAWLAKQATPTKKGGPGEGQG